jgi:hypothetical protein
MFYVFIGREQLLEFLPKGGVVAEIGVAKGDFSQTILDVVKPERLHLIDPWEFQDREDYSKDGNNVSNEEQEDRYQSVTNRFKDEISTGRVVMHRSYSSDAAKHFVNRSLDWVYIDGIHTYDGVTADLEDFAPKVTKDGFILGHDFTNHKEARFMEFGVVKAVNDFVRKRGYGFTALTAEAFPTFVLSQNAKGQQTELLSGKLVYNVPRIVEIRDELVREFEHESVHFGKKDVRVFAKF